MTFVSATDEFMMGKACRPCVTALMINGMYVSFWPVAASNSARFFARMRATRVKSISMNDVTCADVCRDATMCSLMSARIFDIGSTTSPGHGAGGGRACEGGGRREERGADAAVPPDSMKPRMSLFVTRPATPDPCSDDMLTPCSAAILRTSGDDFVRTRSSNEFPLPECDVAIAGVGGC